MPRLPIPGVIALGVVVVVSWLALKPANKPPIGVSSPSPVVEIKSSSDELANLAGSRLRLSQ